MRCALVVLAGCGRLGFDAAATPSPGDSTTIDGDPDAANALLSIDDPADGAVVGGSVRLVGRCTGTAVVEVSGAGVGDGVPSTTCDAGRFHLEVLFTDGLGSKQVTIAQDGRTLSRTYQRVAAPIVPRAAANGATISAGFTVNCELKIDRPAPLFEGDLLVGMIYTDGGDTGDVVTPGFTRMALDGAFFVGFFKTVGTQEPASYTFSITAGIGSSDTCASAGALVAFRNVTGVGNQSSQTSFGTSLIAPGVAADSNNLIVGLFGSNGPLSGISQPPSMTISDGSSAISDGGFANALLAYETVFNQGSTNSRTATIADAAQNATALLVLQPR